MLKGPDISSPKLTVVEKRQAVLPYYAGYSERFVTSVLDHLSLGPESRVLDPWNGAGTTTYVAACRGIKSEGVDLNPVLTIAARARCASLEDADSVASALKQFRIGHSKALVDRQEGLAEFYRRLRHTLEGERLSRSADAILLAGAFSVARDLARDSRSSNPTWYLSTSPSSVLKTSLARSYFASLTALVQRLQQTTRPTVGPQLKTADITTSVLPNAEFDAVITSPPYLTRIDYVKATLPELTFLTQVRKVDSVRTLRTKMIGSPIVGLRGPRASAKWGVTANRVANQIISHPSKASTGYYKNFFLTYFARMHGALCALSRSLREGGSAVIVVQNSYYKEIRIDLAQVIAEMGERVGLTADLQFDFPQARSMLSVNSRATSSETHNVVESALILKRQGHKTR